MDSSVFPSCVGLVVATACVVSSCVLRFSSVSTMNKVSAGPPFLILLQPIIGQMKAQMPQQIIHMTAMAATTANNAAPPKNICLSPSRLISSLIPYNEPPNVAAPIRPTMAMTIGENKSRSMQTQAYLTFLAPSLAMPLNSSQFIMPSYPPFMMKKAMTAISHMINMNNWPMIGMMAMKPKNTFTMAVIRMMMEPVRTLYI